MAESFFIGPVNILDTTAYCDSREIDLGAPVPVQETVANLLSDGSTVSGERSDNRELVIPLTVKGTTYDEMVQRMNLLAQTIEQQQFMVTWTPPNDRPIVFDCFRGAITFGYDRLLDDVFARDVELRIPAYPFTRDPALRTASGGTTPLTIQEFDSLTNITPATSPPHTVTLDTTTKVSGTASMKIFTPGGSNSGRCVTVAQSTGLAVVSRVTDTRITVRLRFDIADVNDEVWNSSIEGGDHAALWLRPTLQINGGAVARPVEGQTVNGGAGTIFVPTGQSFVTLTFRLADLGFTGGATVTSFSLDLVIVSRCTGTGLPVSDHTRWIDLMRLEGGDASVEIKEGPPTDIYCGLASLTTVAGVYRAPARLQAKIRDNKATGTPSGLLIARWETASEKQIGSTHAVMYKTGADKPALLTVNGVSKALPPATGGRWAIIDTPDIVGSPTCNFTYTLVTLGGSDPDLEGQAMGHIPKPCEIVAVVGVSGIEVVSPDGQQSSGQGPDGAVGRAAFFLRPAPYVNTFFVLVSSDLNAGSMFVDLSADYYPRWLAERDS